MRYIQLENNTVVNVIEAEPEFLLEAPHLNLTINDEANIGDQIINGQIIKYVRPEPIQTLVFK